MGDTADYYADSALLDDLEDNNFDDISDDEFRDMTDNTIPKAVLVIREEREPFPMLKKTTKKKSVVKIDTRPKLIHCGNHLIDPNDVVCITKVRSHKDLYIVKLRSNPNPEYPIWINEADITPLIQQFNVVTE